MALPISPTPMMPMLFTVSSSDAIPVAVASATG
jgi:hypothetical protein